MGQKVHPNGFRLGVIRSWDAVWYSDKKTFSNTLEADMRVRKIIKQALAKAGIAQILIERPAKSMSVTVHTARPGMVIGKKGEDVERLKRELSDVAQVPVQLKILEVKKPEINAQLIADGIASQLERRVMFRRAMRRGLQNAMRSGAQGVKIRVSGRLNGADIARCEWSREGRVPLHTLRADIAYGTAEAKTTNGIVGVKVWVFKGEILGKQVLSAVESSTPHPSDKRQNFKSAGRRGS